MTKVEVPGFGIVTTPEDFGRFLQWAWAHESAYVSECLRDSIVAYAGNETFEEFARFVTDDVIEEVGRGE